jgi:anti-anti-sigma factor
MAESWGAGVRRPLCGVQRIGDELLFFGEIDESNADDLAAQSVAEIKAGVVTLDLSHVRFFGAAGVRLIFAARTVASADGVRMGVVCSPEVMRTLEVCRLDGLDGVRLTAPSEYRNGHSEARPHRA